MFLASNFHVSFSMNFVDLVSYVNFKNNKSYKTINNIFIIKLPSGLLKS